MSVPPRIFDPARRRSAAERALAIAARKGADAFLLEDMAEDVLERIDFMQLDAGRALVIGAELTGLSASLRAAGWQVDVPDPLGFDEEHPWGESYDLVVNLGRLDRINDLPGALLHMRHALSEGGIAIAAILGAGSLPRLREAMLAADGERPAARLHPMIDSGSATALMQRAGFRRQVVDSHTMEVRYATLDRLVADLRAHSFGNQLVSRPPALTRESRARARDTFAAAARDGKTTEIFELLTLTGWG